MGKYFTYLAKKDGSQIKLSADSLNKLRHKRSTICKQERMLYVSPILKVESELPMQFKAVIKGVKHGTR